MSSWSLGGASCAESSLVRLFDFGTRQCIAHFGTGEVKQVWDTKHEIGPASLEFDGDTIDHGRLVFSQKDGVGEGGAVVALSAVFDLALDKFEDGTIVGVRNTRSQSVARIADLELRLDAKVFVHTSAGVEFKAETYWHYQPRMTRSALHDGLVGFKAWFAMPWVISFLLGPNYPKNYIGKQAPGWRHALSEMDCDPGCLRSSSKSAQAKARARTVGGKSAVGDFSLSSELEFTCTGGGLILLCLYLSAHQSKCKLLQRIGAIDKATILAELLIDKFLSGDSVALPMPLAQCTLCIRNGQVDIELLHDSQRASGLQKQQFIGKSYRKDVGIVAFLKNLYSESRLAQRTSNWRARHKAVLSGFAEYMSILIEAREADSMWKERTHLFLGTLLPPGSSRSRRVPGGLKHSIMARTRGSKRIRRPGQLLEGMDAACEADPEKKRRRVTAISSRSVENFEVYQYWLAGRTTAPPPAPPHLWIGRLSSQRGHGPCSEKACVGSGQDLTALGAGLL